MNSKFFKQALCLVAFLGISNNISIAMENINNNKMYLSSNDLSLNDIKTNLDNMTEYLYITISSYCSEIEIKRGTSFVKDKVKDFVKDFEKIYTKNLYAIKCSDQANDKLKKIWKTFENEKLNEKLNEQQELELENSIEKCEEIYEMSSAINGIFIEYLKSNKQYFFDTIKRLNYEKDEKLREVNKKIMEYDKTEWEKEYIEKLFKEIRAIKQMLEEFIESNEKIVEEKIKEKTKDNVPFGQKKIRREESKDEIFDKNDYEDD